MANLKQYKALLGGVCDLEALDKEQGWIQPKTIACLN